MSSGAKQDLEARARVDDARRERLVASQRDAYNTVRLYTSPAISVTTPEQAETEIAFLRRLTEYGMLNHITYQQGLAQPEFGGEDVPVLGSGITVTKGSPLDGFYEDMISAVREGLSFSYQFWLDRTLKWDLQEPKR